MCIPVSSTWISNHFYYSILHFSNMLRVHTGKYCNVCSVEDILNNGAIAMYVHCKKVQFWMSWKVNSDVCQAAIMKCDKQRWRSGPSCSDECLQRTLKNSRFKLEDVFTLKLYWRYLCVQHATMKYLIIGKHRWQWEYENQPSKRFNAVINCDNV